ncbi:MAG TPA: tRNA cyclic N6-threonylcarbamoyladenosine(37) synthase TcdA [Chromatiales bacterium]|nr:tRNA cyclic N6-threonylcarbamoyladenosine(37) synthase TcdA [Chromatiales bacterium]
MTDYHHRFEGLERLYGREAYGMLRQLHMAVIGIGGVGSWAAEALARSGIGALTLVDYDEVAAGNVNRQIHALSDTLGQKKIKVMAERIRLINPDCEIRLVDDFLNMDNLEEILGRGYACVIDAIDSIKFKAAMIHYCRRNKIPVIATGGAGGLTDPAMIQVADLSRTHHDPLASRVRARLRERYGYSRNPKRPFGVECVFSSQQPVYPKPDGSVSHAKPGIHGVSLDCRFGYGTSVCVTASFGLLAASRAIHKILKKRRTGK